MAKTGDVSPKRVRGGQNEWGGLVDGKNGRRGPKTSEGGWEMARTGDEGQKTVEGGSGWQKRLLVVRNDNKML
jgi:hypothetical protein